jgi:hypothetical protein
LIFKIYNDVISCVPTGLNFNSKKFQLYFSSVDVSEIELFQIRNIFDNSILDCEKFILNPTFENNDVNLIALIILIAVSRNRLLNNAI